MVVYITATDALLLQGTFSFLLSWMLSSPTMHTAIDDLEYFLWILIWALTELVENVPGTTNNNPGILPMKRAFKIKVPEVA
jgi:hypothetical protein